MKKSYKINKSKKLQKKKNTIKGTKRRLKNKKVLRGGAGAPISTKPKIMIMSSGDIYKIKPIVTYLKWEKYVDFIFLNTQLLQKSDLENIKKSSGIQYSQKKMTIHIILIY